jgi:hypothetical protein
MKAAIGSVGLALSLASVGGAQSTASITGQITDRASGRALLAEVIGVGLNRSVRSDSSGHYEFAGLPAGLTITFQARALGFKSALFTLQLPAGSRLTQSIMLDSADVAQTLPAVDVSSTVNYRLADFERRRQTGRGQYMTDADIKRTGASTLLEAVRGLRGVLYECGGGGGCYVRMARAPMRCLPEFIVDQQVMNDFGPRTPIGDIVAIELYTGPGDVAGEFAGRNAGCGVIVIWTRSGPSPRRP